MSHTETFADGIWMPSVTTILNADEKPWIAAWREKWGPLAERKMRLSGMIGNEFHKCVEDYINDGSFCAKFDRPFFMTHRLHGMMNSFVNWAMSINGKIDSTELKVISRKYAYSGTLDAVGTLDGKPVIFDWKTGSRIYDDMELQLAAYAQAYLEMTGTSVKKGIIVHVSKDKPRFKLSTKTFKLGKRPLNKFLKLRANFDDVLRRPAVAGT